MADQRNSPGAKDAPAGMRKRLPPRRSSQARHEPSDLRFDSVVWSSAVQQCVDDECGQGVRVLCG
jgi:hypothetical protein